MTEPLERIRTGALFTALVVAVAVVGYHYISEKSWLDSLFFVVITISTVGFGESSELPAAAQWLTIGTIVFGMTAAGYTMSGVLQMVTEGEVRRILGVRRMKMEIDRLEGHILVCGFGRIGRMLCGELHAQHRPFVIVESNPQRADDAEKHGYLVMRGDATTEEVLLSAGLERAQTIVTALPSDADNVFITLTARNVNPDVMIIARGEYPSSEKKFLQAGANRVVLPAAIGAQRMAGMIMRPSTLELMDLVTDREVLEVELNEMYVVPDSGLVGQSIRDADVRASFGLLIVAIKKHHGGMVFNPAINEVIEGRDTLIGMGRAQDLDRFREHFGLQAP